MPHNLFALIAQKNLIDKMASGISAARAFDLEEQNMALLPVMLKLFAHFGDYDGDNDQHDEAAYRAGMWRVGLNLDAWISQHAQAGSIAHIQTDYCGGISTQGAIVWQRAEVEYFPDSSALPINKALAKLGVIAKGTLDRFDTLGLSQYRSMWRLGEDK